MTSTNQLFRSSYASQIASEEWAAFRKGILKKRNYCESCKRGSLELQVHHIFYEPELLLWEYDENDVMVLCVECHKSLHEELKTFRKFVFRFMNPQSFMVFNRALLVAMTQYQPLVFAHAFAEFVGNERLVESHAKAFGLETAKQEHAGQRVLSIMRPEALAEELKRREKKWSGSNNERIGHKP